MVMTKAHAKRKQDIKGKLMAAVAMLLVSSIMMVTSTYAWFTLSTAPEVKGITTAVGANGNLEMALIPNNPNAMGEVDFGITSGVGDANLDTPAKNITWGNLVDLSSGYGLDLITLYPAALVDGDIANDGTILKTPVYGADGRVKQLTANGVAGAYAGGVFNQGGFGVRAVGTQSNVSALELAYNNAVSKAGSFTNAAKNAGRASMSANGSKLVSMAATHVLDENATYTANDIAVLQAVIDSTNAALDSAESAIAQYVLAHTIGVSNSEASYGAFLTAAEGLTAANMGTTAGNVTVGGSTFIVNSSAAAALTKLAAARNRLAAAQTAMPTTKGSYAWADITNVVTQLASITGMVLSDGTTEKAVGSLDKNTDAVFVINATTLTMSTGSGIYADIADLTGDYETNISITINYQSQDVSRNVLMVAHTTSDPALLAGAKAGLTKPTASGGGSQPISDYYGYIIDLAFRTNAAGSKLLLQTEGVDRIYSGNTANADTMGAGSTMTFESTDPNFTSTQMLSLLENLKIVFFDTSTGTILANGELGNANVTGGSEPTYTKDNESGTYGKVVTDPVYALVTDLGGNSYTGYRYERTGTGTEGDPYVYTQKSDGTYGIKVAAKTSYKLLTDASMTGYTGDKYTQTPGSGGAAKVECSIVLSSGSSYITELEQNVAKAVSVLVYLDGNGVTNADVAVSGKLNGKMNLQFASDANLVPMDYNDLKNGTGTGSETPAAPTVANVTIAEGSTATGTAKYVESGNSKAVVYIPGASESVTAVTIDSQSATKITYEEQEAWSVTVDQQPTSVVVVVTTGT